MKKFISFVVYLFILLLISMPAIAGTKVFVKEYTYRASEADSKLTCRALAFDQVKRLLLEEIGVYLESYTEVKNFQLTKDKIIAITAGVVRAEKIAEKWDGKKYWLKAKITVDPEKVAQQLNEIRQDRQKDMMLGELKNNLEIALKENEKLKEEIRTSKGEGKKSLKEKYIKNVDAIAAVSYTEEGNSYLFDFDLEKAITSFTKAIELNSNDFIAFTGRTFAYALSGRYENALKDADMAIKLNSQKPLGYYAKGLVYVDTGQYSGAIEYLSKAIERAPNIPPLYCHRGTIFGMAGNKRGAIEDFQKAAEIGSLDSLCYSYRGLYYLNVEKDFKTALSDFQEAIKLDANNVLAYLSLGLTYGMMNKFDLSIETFNKIIEMKPKLSTAYVGRAAVYNELGDFDKAIGDYTTVIKLMPDGAKDLYTAYSGRAGILNYKKKRYDDAIQDYTRMISLNPKDAIPYAGRGHAYYGLKRIDNAIQDYEKACEMDVRNCEFLNFLNTNKSQLLAKGQSDLSTDQSLRIFRPGDNINYKLTGYVNISGIDVPIVGNVQYKNLDETQTDLYGTPCNIYRMNFDYMALGRNASRNFVMVIDQYFTQDSNGSILIHGEVNPYKKEKIFVKSPSNGRYYGFKFPLNRHESISQNIEYTDASREHRTILTLGEEEISCPAGKFNAVKIIINITRTEANRAKLKTMETYWIVPQIGPVRMNLENHTLGIKFILEMSETNITTK